MNLPLRKLKGIPDEVQVKLKEQGFRTSKKFLDASRTPAGRKALAEAVGIDQKILLELANRADLARVRGIGGVYSDLLEHAGIDTVKEMATRRPEASLVHCGRNSLPVFDHRPLMADGGRWSAIGGLDCYLIYAEVY